MTLAGKVIGTITCKYSSHPICMLLKVRWSG